MVEPTRNPIYRPLALEPAPDSLPPGAIVHEWPGDPAVRISKTVYINDHGAFFRVVSVRVTTPWDPGMVEIRRELEICPALYNGDMDMDEDGQPNWGQCTVAGDTDEECREFVDLINATFCATPTSTPLFMLHDFCGR